MPDNNQETIIKDANDMLQAWMREGIEPAEQVERVKAMMAGAPTMVEEAARWAGSLKGVDRDRGFETAFKLIGCMTRIQRAQYRSRLAELLGIGVREFNDLVKASSSESERPGEIVETLGGWFRALGEGEATSGRGWLVEYVYDAERDEPRLAYRDPDGKIGVTEALDIEGVRYIPKKVNRFIRDGGVIFPSEIGASKPTRELVAIVEAMIHEHYLLESQHVGRIMAYYVLLTWMYDAFNALCYLRAMGEAGAGKSELMRRIGYMCYRTLSSSGASSSSSFFRATELYRGTVFIDEADLHDGGDMANDLIKFLNLGAMKGNPIWRMVEEITPDGARNLEVTPFATFCPKLVAMRKDFRDDAVGSRCLTFKLMPKEPLELKRRGVKLHIDDAFRQRALKIRNLLLRWRLDHWRPEIQMGEELIDLEISSRLNQVTMPIKALALIAEDDGLLKEIEQFLRAYNAEIVLTRSMGIAARVVEALWKIYRYPDLRQTLVATEGQREYIMIGDVTRIANEIMDEMNEVEQESEGEEPASAGAAAGATRKYKKKGLTARGVGYVVRGELQLEVGGRKKAGFPVYWDAIKLEALAKRYGVDWEAIGAQSPQAPGKPGGETQGKLVIG